MNCPGIDRQHERPTARFAHCASVPTPDAHWTTTHLYFSGVHLDADMKRFCLGLIVLLTIVGAQALA